VGLEATEDCIVGQIFSELGMEIGGRDEPGMLDSSPLSTGTISDIGTVTSAHRISPAAIAGIAIAAVVVVIGLVLFVVIGSRRARQVRRMHSHEAQHQIPVEKPTDASFQTHSKNQKQTKRTRWHSWGSTSIVLTRKCWNKYADPCTLDRSSSYSN
jgi:hypothetical protein